jgi:hypothetical protein
MAAERSEGRVGNPRLSVTMRRSQLRPAVGAPVERIGRRSQCDGMKPLSASPKPNWLKKVV